jgi:MarR family transcriptional regulator for hemolysin
MSEADPTELFGMALAETARLWRTRLDQRLRPLGLSQAKWRVLLHLAKGGDGMVQRELAERVSVEGPTLVRLLDRMTADGWIERRDSASDRRSKTVHLTDKAQGVTRQIERIARQLRKELLAGLARDDLLTCIAVFDGIKHKAEHL